MKPNEVQTGAALRSHDGAPLSHSHSLFASSSRPLRLRVRVEKLGMDVCPPRPSSLLVSFVSHCRRKKRHDTIPRSRTNVPSNTVILHPYHSHKLVGAQTNPEAGRGRGRYLTCLWATKACDVVIHWRSLLRLILPFSDLFPVPPSRTEAVHRPVLPRGRARPSSRWDLKQRDFVFASTESHLFHGSPDALIRKGYIVKSNKIQPKSKKEVAYSYGTKTWAPTHYNGLRRWYAEKGRRE